MSNECPALPIVVSAAAAPADGAPLAPAAAAAPVATPAPAAAAPASPVAELISYRRLRWGRPARGQRCRFGGTRAKVEEADEAGRRHRRRSAHDRRGHCRNLRARGALARPHARHRVQPQAGEVDGHQVERDGAGGRRQVASRCWSVSKSRCLRARAFGSRQSCRGKAQGPAPPGRIRQFVASLVPHSGPRQVLDDRLGPAHPAVSVHAGTQHASWVHTTARLVI